MKKGISIAVFFAVVCTLSLYAQQEPSIRLTGKVEDAATGKALAGVSVSIQGGAANKIAFMTNKEGRYAFRAAPTDTILFSYIGYNTLRFSASAITSEQLIKLETVNTKLDEVVVIGYGSVAKKDLTGAVGQVNMSDLSKAPVPSFDQALAGRIAGVQVNSNEGQPGGNINITIRGGNSLTQSNMPLYVIDGFPIEDFSGASINPDDIASITVLKDASATAIYGSRGANGVVIIETKKGSSGQAEVTYNAYYGRQYITKKMEMMNPYEFVKYQLELDPVRSTEMYLTKPNRKLDDYLQAEDLDWQSRIFKPAGMQNHSLSVRGGSAGTKYFFSGNIVDQDGIVINSGFKRGQARLNLEQKLSKKVTANVNINYSRDNNYGNFSSLAQSPLNMYASYLMYRIWGYRPVTTGVDITEELFDEEDPNAVFLMNPVISTSNEIRKQTRSELLMNAGITYSIHPNLTLNVRGGITNRTNKNEAFFNSKTYKGFPSTVNLKGVNGTFDNIELQNWLNENTLTFKKRLSRISLIDATAGFTMQGMRMERYGFESTNIPNEELGLRALELGLPSSVTSSASKNTLASFLGRVNYNLLSKYLFTASIRADGSSKFSPENRWGYFPSGAIAWNMGREPFMKQAKFVSDAKLRVSYGVTGNNRINDFSRFQSVDITDFYSFNNATPGYAGVIDNIGNMNLRWERTAQVDIGYDLSFFKNRLNIVADFYQKNTSGLLLNAKLPYSSGFATAFKNVGKVRNTGWEFTLNTVNVESKKFSWNTSFNISFNQNKVMALAESQQNILSSVRFTGTYNSSFLYIAQLGGPAAAFYGYVWDGNYQYEDFDQLSDGSYLLKQAIATNGNSRSAIQPGDIKYVDQNGDGVVNDKDMVIIGSALPKHFGGITNNFTYKGFSLNVFFQWSYGNEIMNANRLVFEGNFANRPNFNQFASYNNRWTPENQNDLMPRARGFGPQGMYSSRTMEDGSYVRLKTAQLSYAFPKKMIGKVKALEVYVSGQNLLTWTDYTGMDPEVSTKNTTLTPGFDYSAYPRSMTLTFGAKATF